MLKQRGGKQPSEMTDYELFEALEYSSHKSELIEELGQRTRNNGFNHLGECAVLKGPQTVEVEDEEYYRVTDVGETFSRELTFILRFDFTEGKTGRDAIYRPWEAKEFCSEEGGILDLTLSDLTEQQKKLLLVIRKFYRRWEVDQQKED